MQDKSKSKWKDSVRLADEIIRPNPFLLSRDKEATSVSKLRKRYGDSGDMIIVTGRLFEEDRGTLIAFLEMSEETEKRLDFYLPEVAKVKGVKNPYAESVLGPIRESIGRLLTAQLQLNLIKPSREKKLRARFVFLKGYLDSNDHGNITVSNYLETVRDLALGFTYIKPSLYFSFKGQLSRSLYTFLQSHKAICKGSSYSVRLSKLCNHINYGLRERAWSQVWQHINGALEKLKKAGVIARYIREKDRCRIDGGVITTWGPKKQMEKKTEAKHLETERLLKQARGLVTTKLTAEDESQLIKYIDGLVEYDSQVKKVYGTGTDEFGNAYTRSIGDFTGDFIAWLQRQQWLKQVPIKTFSVDGKVFWQFVQDRVTILSSVLKNKADLDERLARHKQRLNEKPKHKRKRKKPSPVLEELRRKQARCPYGDTFGDDYEEGGSCFDCYCDFREKYEECRREFETKSA